MIKYIGIDPGRQGAIAIIYGNELLDYTTMMVGGKDLNLSAIAKWLRENTHSLSHIFSPASEVVACIENVHAMPGQGVTSMFSFGFVTGAIHGILATLEIPYHLVTPQAWKKEILAGTAKDKLAAIDWCLRAYPGINLLATPKSHVPHSGLADAICIAEYCSRHF